MWCLETIKMINDSSVETAKVNNLKPCVITSRRQIYDRQFDCPMLGDACDTVDQTHVDRLFVDISGIGHPSEPALTMSQFQNKLEDLFTQHGSLAIALSEHSQFQGYVEVWRV